MRAIEFRGKILDSLTDEIGDWTFGSLVQQKDKKDFSYIIIPNDQSSHDKLWIDYGCLGYLDEPVDILANYVLPETIGQFTGLTDKYGNKIFEGDILTNEERVLFSRSYYFAVKFKNGKIYGDGGRIKIKKKNFKYLEIVGNIYENSYFLEDN